jgi:hypothetical protein
MSINLNLKHLSIVKQSDNYYKLCFLQKNEIFLQSIVVPMLLDGAFMNDSFNTIEFYAHSVKPLSLYLQYEMPYNSVIHLLWYLSKQHDFLKKHGYVFYCLHLNDILVVDDCKFICVNPEIVKQLKNENENENENETITFYSPFLRNGFVSPEILNIECIPASVSYRCFYYSLGALAVYCYFGINICDLDVGVNGDDLDDTHLVYSKIIDILSPISDSKLYWCLLKCLCVDSNKRSLLFV